MKMLYHYIEQTTGLKKVYSRKYRIIFAVTALFWGLLATLFLYQAISFLTELNIYSADKKLVESYSDTNEWQWQESLSWFDASHFNSNDPTANSHSKIILKSHYNQLWNHFFQLIIILLSPIIILALGKLIQWINRPINSNNVNLNNNESNELYYLIIDGKQSPPFTFEQLKNRRILEEELVWKSGLTNWVKAKELIELKSILVHIAPPLPFSSQEEKSVPLKNSIQESTESKYAESYSQNETGFSKLILQTLIGGLIIAALAIFLYVISENKQSAEQNINEETAAVFIPGELEFNSAVNLLDNQEATVSEIDSAVNLLRQSISLNYNKAYSKLGDYYKTAQNFQEAFKLYSEGCDLQDPVSCGRLAGFYYYGINNISKNQDSALHFLLKAVELDTTWANAYNTIGCLYLSKEEYQLAMSYFLKAVEKGNYASNAWVGYLYENGQQFGFETNKSEAFRLYLQSIPGSSFSEGGEQWCINNVARCYEFGIGVKQNLDSALYYYSGAGSNLNPSNTLFDDAYHEMICKEGIKRLKKNKMN